MKIQVYKNADTLNLTFEGTVEELQEAVWALGLVSPQIQVKTDPSGGPRTLPEEIAKAVKALQRACQQGVHGSSVNVSEVQSMHTVSKQDRYTLDYSDTEAVVHVEIITTSDVRAVR